MYLCTISFVLIKYTHEHTCSHTRALLLLPPLHRRPLPHPHLHTHTRAHIQNLQCIILIFFGNRSVKVFKWISSLLVQSSKLLCLKIDAYFPTGGCRYLCQTFLFFFVCGWCFGLFAYTLNENEKPRVSSAQPRSDQRPAATGLVTPLKWFWWAGLL